MLKKLLLPLVLIYGWYSSAQECPTPVLTNPVNGATNVSINSTISWNAVAGVPGYIISIGTTPMGTELLNRLSVGIATSYTPPMGLPDNTQIYVTITLFFFEGGIPEIPCSSETFSTEDITTPPSCTTLSSPVDGAVDVNVASNLSWNYASSATGYRLTLGTAPGLGDLLNNFDLGNSLFYNPPADFPPNSDIYVRLEPYNDNGPALGCMEESFTTGDIASLPGCSNLISPVNGATDVPLTPNIQWAAVPGATGYKVTIGSTPFTAEILDNVSFFTNETFVIDFEPNRTFFITIVPFNDAGTAIGCVQESFSTLLGCGPYFDLVTGELVTLNPEINFPDTVSFCQNEAPFTVTTTDIAEGYRWYSVDQFGNETLLSETAEVALTSNGQYRYEAYNTASQSGGAVECPSTKIFNVVSSELATITSLDITSQGEGIRIGVQVSGIGDYEYALDAIAGPYQDAPLFENVTLGVHTVYVRDKNGCGIAEERISPDLTLEGFPKFFTPNGDGINDFWQFVAPPTLGDVTLNSIQIFDRFGRLLAQIEPSSIGWDGNYNGKPLPSSDYWFRAEDETNKQIQGHFALKR